MSKKGQFTSSLLLQSINPVYSMLLQIIYSFKNIIAHFLCTRYTDVYLMSVDIVGQKRDNILILIKLIFYKSRQQGKQINK